MDVGQHLGASEVLIVTGGGSGIGFALCELCLSRDDVVAGVLDVSEGRVDDLRRRFGRRVVWMECDVADHNQVERAAAEVASMLGSASLLANCAGVVHFEDSIALGDEAWRRVLGAHLDGTFHACQAFGRQMAERGGGAIVNVSSVAAHFAWPRRLPYAVAKAGIEALTRTLAVEWASLGVRVNAVAPGFVDTPMVQRAIDEALVQREVIADQHALGRLAQPYEIAEVIRFLFTSASSFITGATVPVDGGFSVKRLP